MTGWDGILDPGEEVIWQGRPDGAVVFKRDDIGSFLFGLTFAGFALLWIAIVSRAGGFFWMLGLVHFGVGFWNGIGRLLWSAFRRRRSWYSLSNRRAFIATDMPLKGRKLQSYPIGIDTALSFKDGPLPTLHFAEALRRGKNGRRRVKVGFERIAEGRDVYRMMRDIQRAARHDGHIEDQKEMR